MVQIPFQGGINNHLKVQIPIQGIRSQQTQVMHAYITQSRFQSTPIMLGTHFASVGFLQSDCCRKRYAEHI